MLRWAAPATKPSDVMAYFMDSPKRSGADYYLEDLERGRGQWIGRGAERLGLIGDLQKDHFDQLCRNERPDHHNTLSQPERGEARSTLTERNKPFRRVGWDVTFNAPKSLSLLWAATGDPRIVAALQQSVRETLNALEQHAAVRVRKGGADCDRTTGNLVAALFTHHTSRPTDEAPLPDPQLHVHAFVFNASYDHHEERWKALQTYDMRLRSNYYEAVFHSRLSKAIADLGYPLERRGYAGWEIATVNRPLIERFSRRTSQIMAKARELGLTDPASIAELGGMTRARKSGGKTLEELHRFWTAQLSSEELKAIRNPSSSISPIVPHTPQRCIEHAVDHCFERHSVVEDIDLKRAALRYGMGTLLPEAIDPAFAQAAFLKHTDEEQHTWITTRTVLDEERAMIRFAQSGINTRTPLGDPDRVIQSRDVGGKPITLNADQQAACRHIWGCTDRIIAIRGRAGTGKTTLMREAIEGIESKGKRVIALAPSAEASRGELRRAGLADADTVAMFLTQPKMQEAARNQVIWIDEASLLGSRTMIEMMKAADRLNARIILSGDRGQHHSVERGDPLAVLETYAGIRPVEVREIQRQKGEYRKAVHNMSEGRVAKALKQLDRMGAILEIPGDERHARLAEDYARLTERDGSVLVVCPTHAEGQQATEAIRRTLIESGRLPQGEDRVLIHNENMQWTHAQKANPENYEIGQRIHFHKAAPGIPTGSWWHVLSEATPTPPDPHSRIVQLVNDKGRIVTLPLHEPDRFTLHQPREIRVRPGDLVRFTQNSRSADGRRRINNGTVHRVKSIRQRGRGAGNLILEPVAGRGKPFEVEATNGMFTQGYCVTSHASQGRTVDHVLIAQGSESMGAASREQFYVSVSRGAKDVRIYTDDKQLLLRSAERSEAQTTAMDLARKAGVDLRMEKAREHHRIRLVGWWREMRNRTVEAARQTRIKTQSLVRMQLIRSRGYRYER